MRAVRAELVMLLAGPSATLRGKLTEKVRYRPTATIAPLLPAGTDTLVKVRPGVPERELVRSEPTEAEMEEYCKAIRRTAAVFARNHHKDQGGHACRARQVP